MTDTSWELYDTDARSVLAVGSLWHCQLARHDALVAPLALATSPGELVVRPHVSRGLHGRARALYRRGA